MIYGAVMGEETNVGGQETVVTSADASQVTAANEPPEPEGQPAVQGQESKASAGEPVEAEDNKGNEIIVTATNETDHPVEGRSVEVSPLDGRIGVNMPCPIVDKIGPVKFTCGAGISAYDPAVYGLARATMPLNELLPLKVLEDFRLVAQTTGYASPEVQAADLFVGIASPPIKIMGNQSVAAGFNGNGEFRFSISGRF